MEHVETEISKFENEEEFEESEDEKKKKIRKVTKREKKKREPLELPSISKMRHPETEPLLKIPGLKNVKLSSLTQKILGCIVGEHVSAEAPWVVVSKVVVDENLFLHHDSSDFLPVKEELAEYTGSSILVGYDPNFMPFEDEDFHRFYIAVTEEAKNEMMSRLEKEKELAEEKLKNSVNKKILPWDSLGSEVEVDDSLVMNTRPLIQLELETDIDELLQPVRFKDRDVEDAKDGYVRIGPGRIFFQGIPRLQIDEGVQAVPALVPKTAQTDPGLPLNAWTQYLYDEPQPEEPKEESETEDPLTDHVFPERNYLEKALEYNENFDLYVNDYPLLILEESDTEVAQKSVFEEYEAYTDVSHCKNKLISSIAWHPMWSGIVALAYTVAVRCVTAADIDLGGDEVNRDVFSKNSVLLWSFKDALKPRLILESPREVYTLAWSPVDPNILVGGCASGQIIVWDLKGNLEAVENHEYLTPDQQRYRLVMQTLVSWLQPQPPAQYVRPVALSDIKSSHTGKITHIQWISPYFEWNENGHYVKTAVEEGKTSMQLISAGEDGMLRVWDLNKIPEDIGGSYYTRRRKVRKRPSALNATISPFRMYDRKIRPMYLLYPKLPEEKSATKLTALSISMKPVVYKLDPEFTKKMTLKLKRKGSEPKPSMTSQRNQDGQLEEPEDISFSESQLNEDTFTPSEITESGEKLLDNRKSEMEARRKEKESSKEKAFARKAKSSKSSEYIRDDSITQRKIYRPSMQVPEELPPQMIQVTTDEGDCIAIKWEGFEFHKGELITTEEGSIVSWGTAVHDGPIVACVRSPFLDDLVLTVGGQVTALWKQELQNQPLFWKYSPVAVTCASWSPYRPCMFHVGRSDGSLEVWDLARSSDVPTLVQSISGKVLTTMAEHTLPLPGNRSVLGVADFNKSFRLLYFPEEYKTPQPNELETLKNFVEREVFLRQAYLEWNENFIKSNAQELAKIKAKEEEAEKKHKEAELAAEQEALLRAKLEEEEAKQLAKSYPGYSLTDKYLDRVMVERERQMQRVLMEKKQLNKSDLIAKQQPILMMKQMEKEKRKKQREKIRQQQKIFDKTVAMLFPEVVEKPKEGPSRMDEFEAELMGYQPQLMAQYENLLPAQLKFIKDNPFNKRMKWEKVFEEGMLRRNILDFPLYLRQKRKERYMNSKMGRRRMESPEALDNASKSPEDRKAKVGFQESVYSVMEDEEESQGTSSKEEEDILIIDKADEGFELGNEQGLEEGHEQEPEQSNEQ